MRRQEFVYLDPANNSPFQQAIYEDQISKFFQSRVEYKEFRFKRVYFNHPTQSDEVSCGVYVCMFAKVLLEAYNYLVERKGFDFEIDGFRNHMLKKIVASAQKI